MASSSPSSLGQLLLKGGTLLIHDTHNHVQPTHADLLVKDGLINSIAKDIEPPQGAEVLDCTGKIVSPGFIDTHHHLWQTALKGIHADQTLLEYFPCGNNTSSLYDPNDVFWGQLSGALEAIDAGTTTVVDHSHITYQPENVYNALNATLTSGLRTIYCYCPTPRLASWEPFELNQNLLEPWIMHTFDKLVAKAPFGVRGRVTLGFAFDGNFLPSEVLQPLYQHVRDAGIKTITLHATGKGNIKGPDTPSTLQMLQSKSLLGEDMLLSHSNTLLPDDLALLSASGAATSSTPSTELQMGMLEPLALEPLYKAPEGHGPLKRSMGIDCQSIATSSMPIQMNVMLTHARAKRHEQVESRGKWSRNVRPTCEDVFNVATVEGARAVRMEDSIGRIREGFKADFAVFDAETPRMLAAGATDPVAAVVLHSCPGDVFGTVVDGMVRKWEGRIGDVDIVGLDGAQGCVGGLRDRGPLAWRDVVREVGRSREVMMKRMEGRDWKRYEDYIMKAFYYDGGRATEMKE